MTMMSLVIGNENCDNVMKKVRVMRDGAALAVWQMQNKVKLSFSLYLYIRAQ